MKLIGNIKPPAFSKFQDCINDRWRTDEKDMSLGEVYSHNMSGEDSRQEFKHFFALIEESGYKTTDCTLYFPLSLTSCRGSVGEHDDYDYGLVALWLVRVRGLNRGRDTRWGDVPELYASRKWGRVQLGDVVVFNASKKHAWLVNGTCHMLMQTVTKKRVRR
jgi:hypothetical protein